MYESERKDLPVKFSKNALSKEGTYKELRNARMH